MRPKLTSRVWSGGSFLLALLFILWGSSLLFTVGQRQTEIDQHAGLVHQLNELEQAVRDLNQAVTEQRPNEAPETADARWRKLVAVPKQRIQSLAADEPLAQSIHEPLQRLNQRAEELTSLHSQLVRAPLRTAERERLRIAFLATQSRAVDDIRNATQVVRGQLRDLRMELAGKWKQLNVLVVISCVLAIAGSVLLAICQRALSRLGLTEEALRQSRAELEQRVKERTAALAEEVAERQLTEEALRASDTRFRALLEHSSDVVLLLSPEGKILFNAPAKGRILGYVEDAFEGRTIFELLHLEDQAKVRATLALAAQTTQPRTITCRGRHKDGSWRWLEAVTTNLLAEPSVRALVVNYRDTTERKLAEEALRQAHDDLEQKILERTAELLAANTALLEEIEEHHHTEEALRNSEAMYHSLVEHLPMSVYRKDHTGRLVFANHQWCAVRGLAVENALGKTVFDLFPQVLARKYHADDEQVLQTGQVFHDVEEHVTGTGEQIWVEVIKTAVHDHRGKIIGTQGAFWDVTARRRAEDALQRAHEELEQRVAERTADLARSNAELARSNAELQQFAYIASHDLQEPLRAVAGCISLLQQRCGHQLDARAAEYMAHAIDGATRMQALINDLLTYSRVGTRRQRCEPADCNAVLTCVLANLQVAIDESAAQVTAEPLPILAGDPTELAQLFQNLLSNAVKFRGDQAPEIRVRACPENDSWHFTVADNGIGIEPRYFERIFRLFQRLHTRREFPGTGIGLAICKKIVERHGGRIWVESLPGRGATFHFTLPDPR